MDTVHKVWLCISVLDGNNGLISMHPQWEVRGLDESQAYHLAMKLKNVTEVVYEYDTEHPQAVQASAIRQ